ncbi:recombinase XerC [Rhodanobacter thiooxydans]|uniref:Recombinase XerC n=1 Tax=Rhodanobacter thiooxydans TaxID=416169 RepID=A0A154QFI7_9GAMM|nr:tyrosine-type recombinase/integrase [Rhodanobacter thiooxydans]EIL98259.1 site-specific recombinase XerD-like protein [Rhodanobacter thiooxydans LCS2]KZC23008.1 recombinase XerC [Rhodanobacter thiooxydans]
MTKHNPYNERIKRQYFTYLQDAQSYSEATVDAVAKALARFEDDTKYKDFKAFHYEQARAFKRRLMEQRSQQTGKPLSKATSHATLAHLKRFFHWLAGQPGYKSRLQYADADYFNMSAKDTRVATARRESRTPTLEQVRHVINAMPDKTEIERRDRALLAFTLLTGARDSAIASMRLKHVDLERQCVYQDAREVRTKFSKTFNTHFFPVGDSVRAIVEEWVTWLRVEMLWGADNPLFPATRVALGPSRRFEAAGLTRATWSSAGPIRGIFRRAFANAGLSYFNPHSFRHTLVQLGEELCRSPEEFKAWSQNLGHEGVLTTFYSYGAVPVGRQSDIMRLLGASKSDKPIDRAKTLAEIRQLLDAVEA